MINNQTNNSLLILLWNCNGILNHTNELISILHEKRIDIALIAESHLTVNSRLNIPGKLSPLTTLMAQPMQALRS